MAANMEIGKERAPRVKRFRVKRAQARAILDQIPERTFARLESEGVVVPFIQGKGGRASVYDLAEIVPAYLLHLKAATPAGADRVARARRDVSQAELNEIRLEERRKEVLPRDQVVADGRAFVIATKAKLLALPRRLVQAGIVPVDAQPAVAGTIREALEEMARWRTQVDLLKAAHAAA